MNIQKAIEKYTFEIYEIGQSKDVYKFIDLMWKIETESNIPYTQFEKQIVYTPLNKIIFGRRTAIYRDAIIETI